MKLWKTILASLLAFGTMVGMSNVAHAVVVQNTPILTSPPSTDNLWSYSYDAGPNSNIVNATSFATSLSQVSSAVFQGYVAGDVAGDFAIWRSNPLSDFRTAHVFGTHIQSSIDQSITIRAGGDDGHSLFLNGSLLVGGGFGFSAITTLNLVANTSVHLELVGYNYTGPWAHAVGEWNGAAYTNTIENVSGVSINADGIFAPVPEPTTLVLLGLGLAGLGFRARKKLKL